MGLFRFTTRSLVMAGVSREVRAERVRYLQGLIEEHSRSGLSVLEFCKERKVSALRSISGVRSCSRSQSPVLQRYCL